MVARRSDGMANAQCFEFLRDVFRRDPLFGMISPFVVHVDNDSGSVDEISSCPLTVFEQNGGMVMPKEVWFCAVISAGSV